MRKLTIEYIKNRTKELAKGYECLSTNYINVHTHLKFKCDKGHIYLAQWANFQQGKRCPECFNSRKGATQRFNIDYIKKKTVELAEGYKCLSERYINSHTHLRFKCNKGHKYKVTWSSFQAGTRCRKCADIIGGVRRKFSFRYVKERTKELTKGYKLLSREYLGNNFNLKFKCDKGHIFEATWSNFSKPNGTRCSICWESERSQRMTTITIDYVKSYVKEYGYECLSTEYKPYIKLIFKCTKGHIYKSKWNNFQVGARCPECSLKGRTRYDKTTLQELYSYREYVDRLSNKNYCKYYYIINPNRLKRSYTEYHLDHIYSVIDGFKNGILPQIIASPVNLQMLSANSNISKKGNSDMTLDELLKAYDEFNAHK